MAKRRCVGCGEVLTKASRTREHILPQWLAAELKIPNTNLKHFLRDDPQDRDELLREHSLGTFVIKNVCATCNSGWMSCLESRAMPILLGLMNLKTALLELSEEDRTTISIWAVKTAFMIASAQQTKMDLPWALFQRLAGEPGEYPTECSIVAAQLPVPTGFLFACPGDEQERDGPLCQVRVGFTLRHLHFVVVIPFTAGERMIRATGIHIPIWPLRTEILVRFANFLGPTDPKELIKLLTNLVEAGIHPPRAEFQEIGQTNP
jgi:hypothetical protein